MEKKEIEFIIKPNGEVEFTIKGVKGKKCIPLADLFKTLGEVTSFKNTSEYYEEEKEDKVKTYKV
jgi:hypothetical protein